MLSEKRPYRFLADLSDPVLKVYFKSLEINFGMPYGMKRLFQDLWFSMIDLEFKELIFVDKNEGDGSIYCVNENAADRICHVTLEAVIRIRDQLVNQFWNQFRAEFEALTL